MGSLLSAPQYAITEEGLIRLLRLSLVYQRFIGSM
jgi:hypothetical protein